MATLSHLQRLEAESIQIFREAVAESEVPPFPLLHVDTTWKFRAMYEFRDEAAARSGMELLVHQNPECVVVEQTVYVTDIAAAEAASDVRKAAFPTGQLPASRYGRPGT